MRMRVGLRSSPPRPPRNPFGPGLEADGLGPVDEVEVASILRAWDETLDDLDAARRMIRKLKATILEQDTMIERVRALIPKWQSDRVTYPLDDIRASVAFLAVKACEKELLAALEPTP